jgi:hypothetical protein
LLSKLVFSAGADYRARPDKAKDGCTPLVETGKAFPPESIVEDLGQ